MVQRRAKKPEELSRLAGLVPELVRDTTATQSQRAARGSYTVANTEFLVLVKAFEKKGKPIPKDSLIRELAVG